MIDLDFAVEAAEIARGSAVPQLLLKLRISNRTPAVPVEHVTLQAQIRIEAAHRDYRPEERDKLFDLFGPDEEWSRTLRGFLWTHANVPVPSFAEHCTVDLPVPCSYDFELASTKYFYGVDGNVPLVLLFSGPVFFRNPEGDLQITQIAHHKEAAYRLPVQLWRALMEQYYPGSIWLRIGRELFDEIYRYKRHNRLANIEEALRALLAAATERGQSP